MKTIKKGDTGTDVTAWQYFLVGRGYSSVVADGNFGDITKAATVDFQKKNGLTADGTVGTQTYVKASQYGYHLPSDFAPQPEFPPKPAFQPLTPSAIESIFGKIEYQVQPDGSSIKITNDFQSKNIITIDVPQIRNLSPYRTSKMALHKDVAEQFKKLFIEWEKAGLLKYLLSYDGAFNPRLIRGSSTVLSCHAYGIAIDVNVRWNQLGAVPAQRGQTGSVRELVPIANQLGFYWGGHFSRRDGMHFEIAKKM